VAGYRLAAERTLVYPSFMAQVYDVAIVGAGPAGLAAAIALARDGFATCLVGTAAASRDGRTVALLDGSTRFLAALGLWDKVAQQAAAFSQMRIIDDTDNLFRAPPLSFHASEIGLEAFGHNIENAILVDLAAAHARQLPHLALRGGMVADVSPAADAVTLRLDDGTSLVARLVVGADGRYSIVRKAAGIAVSTWSYPQMALTTLLSHERPHADATSEFHTRTGPFTLVPLPGNRSSLVWVTAPYAARRLLRLSDDDLGEAVARQAHRLLGAMRVDGPRGLMPLGGLSAKRLTGPRLALIGEAAHVFPPIGAQGLNLGLRDAASLRDALVDARQRGEDFGGAATLKRYADARRLDVGTRTAMVSGLNRALLTNAWPADLARGLGMLALRVAAPLRNLAMREGVMPSLAVPRLMRADAPGAVPF
jgi:2-octaprenyl-6-methoxyphenol hydroxylase